MIIFRNGFMTWSHKKEGKLLYGKGRHFLEGREDNALLLAGGSKKLGNSPSILLDTI
jgi:hypothetical protein